jgi:cytochrome c oxidase subunit 3
VRSPNVAPAHQFEDVQQQYEASSLGMWIFLVTEIMFFGGLFLVYTVYRHAWLLEFTQSSLHLDVLLGAVNTAVLLSSSLTMALAVHATQTGGRKAAALLMIATMVLGMTFLGVKSVEYYHKYEEGLIPGPGFHFPETSADSRSHEIFFSLYFVMTGMHALHMVIGIGLMALFTLLVLNGTFGRNRHAPVEMLGLYWHFVDIVWVFLFPLLYLIDRSQT